MGSAFSLPVFPFFSPSHSLTLVLSLSLTLSLTLSFLLSAAVPPSQSVQHPAPAGPVGQRELVRPGRGGPGQPAAAAREGGPAAGDHAAQPAAAPSGGLPAAGGGAPAPRGGGAEGPQPAEPGSQPEVRTPPPQNPK